MNEPLSREAFADALRKGKGRAVQHIRAHGDAGVEDLLLEACIHCQSYDPQSEGYRNDWLMGMLGMLPDPQPFYETILGTFLDSTDAHDAEQMAGMLVTLAEQGHLKARSALYDKFDRQEFNEDWMLSARLISLDGVEGLLHVARTLGRRLATDSDFWLGGYLQHIADEQFGMATVDEVLRKAAVDAPDVLRFRHDLRAPRNEEATRDAPYTLDAYLSDLAEGGRKTRLLASRFARCGSESDHRALFELIEREHDASRLAAMLRVFAARIDPPGGVDGILRFARHQDAAVREVTIDVLKRFVDHRLGDLAAELLDAGNLEAIDLLANNSRPGQFARIYDLLPASADEERDHRLGMDLNILCSHHRLPEAFDCLVWVYERTPCSYCRSNAVGELVEMGKLPPAIREECRHDSYDGSREWVADTIQ